MTPKATLVCRGCGFETSEAKLGDLCPGDGLALLPRSVVGNSDAYPLLGRIIAGKYAVIEVVGTGGFGAVYHAIQKPVGRDVAVKVIAGDAGHEIDLHARFFREAKIVASLANPIAVTLHDYREEDDGLLYMVFEYIRGREFRRVIKQEAPSPYETSTRSVKGRPGTGWPLGWVGGRSTSFRDANQIPRRFIL